MASLVVVLPTRLELKDFSAEETTQEIATEKIIPSVLSFKTIILEEQEVGWLPTATFKSDERLQPGD